LAVRVVDTIPINDIYNSGGRGQFSSLTNPTTLVLINSIGEFKAGDPVYGRIKLVIQFMEEVLLLALKLFHIIRLRVF
jgi:hypothetical protein